MISLYHFYPGESNHAPLEQNPPTTEEIKYSLKGALKCG